MDRCVGKMPSLRRLVATIASGWIAASSCATAAEPFPAPCPDGVQDSVGELTDPASGASGPRILNRSDVIQAIVREYPPSLRDRGIGGTVSVWFFVDAFGAVQDTRIRSTSSYQDLDDAALRVAEVVQFRPAESDGCSVPVWVAYPLTFEVRRPTTESQGRLR